MEAYDLKSVNRELSNRICELLGIDHQGLIELDLSIAVGQVPIVRTRRYVKELCDSTSLSGPPFRCSEIKNMRRSQTFSVEFDAPPDVVTPKEIED